MERVTADMIAEKEFSIESKGYNKNEVDNFLDEICEEMDRLNNEIFDLRQKTTMVRPQAPVESTPSGSDESRFREILEMAAQVKEETAAAVTSGLMTPEQAASQVQAVAEQAAVQYDYTWPLVMLACLGIAALILGIVLKAVDKKQNLGLEEPNIKE